MDQSRPRRTLKQCAEAAKLISQFAAYFSGLSPVDTPELDRAFNIAYGEHTALPEDVRLLVEAQIASNWSELCTAVAPTAPKDA